MHVLEYNDPKNICVYRYIHTNKCTTYKFKAN